ncbi:hypothetical protein POJ06DRAFT_254194 [Lipomyces tetrasporus]|uniref:Uncharacterized protein n=1 Tax=Lipomyces tetrasporus TaxID=54092 RepID=A0AAD7QQQ4_9ASCO|nr:uncharacterized protein POJ06DRAFT_254194 [Lipomyces tetrasporus]KAJ8099674.1 hypothetical protein POJ06DRAFT_254194 [Lipomyces tetrasporus]
MRVMTEDEQEDEDAIDGEIAQYLSPHQPTAFSYCVQVHGACNSFGANHQLPSITWATDDFTALRLNSGALLKLTSLKAFLQELYPVAESLLPELCLDIDVPTHFAPDLRDVYSTALLLCRA